MPAEFNILITNDDAYNAKGLRELVEMMRPYGTITVVAPKNHQSGMSTAVSIGNKLIAFKEFKKEKGVTWTYLDATPASCVKFALDKIFPDRKCDLVVCLSHLGWSDEPYGDKTMMAQTRNIDLVLGGHSHSYLENLEWVKNLDGKMIGNDQNGKHAVWVGRLVLDLKKK